MQKPSPGRIVMVPTDPAENNGSLEAPAIVTAVFERPDGGYLVNVRVMLDAFTLPTWRTSQYLHEEKPSAQPLPGCAWWPPRV